MPKKLRNTIRLNAILVYVQSSDLHVVMANFEFFFSNKKRCPKDSALTSHRFLSTLLHFTLDKNVYKGCLQVKVVFSGFWKPLQHRHSAHWRCIFG